MPNQQPKDIRIEDYTYTLPDERIARYPLAQRDASRLLVFRDSVIQESTYRRLADFLPENSLLVFNNTRVIPARLQFTKSTGSIIEIFCLEPVGEITTGLTARGSAVWECLVGGIKKWKSGPLTLESHGIALEAHLRERGRETCTVEFRWTPEDRSFSEVIEQTGQVPLPPYLQRPAEAADRERYQTIYARHEGSVAAPTAGLHFTEAVMHDMAARGIRAAYVTLHVGAGTFRPVKSETLADHDMHAEYFDVDKNLIRQLRDHLAGQQPVVAVGTTSLRTLESIFLMGSKLLKDKNLEINDLEIKQWDAYAPHHSASSAAGAFEALLQWMETRALDRLVARTQLLIAPGYTIRTIEALVTNFHQPASTLLLLVAALVGDDWRRIYNYALENDFRFLSYGDGSLLFRTP